MWPLVKINFRATPLMLACVFLFSSSATAVDVPYYLQNQIGTYGETVASECSNDNTSDAATALRGDSNLEKIYNFFADKGLSPVQSAGVVGNISQESGGDPQNTQGGYTPDRTTDPTKVSTKNGKQGGWGIIQWTPSAKVVDIAKNAGITGPIHELETQLEVVWWHMNNTSPTGVKNMLQDYKGMQDVAEATKMFEDKMEGAGKPAMDNRIQAAKNALSSYGRGGNTIAATSPSSTSNTSNCSCSNISSSGVATDSAKQIDVVLDPGHTGAPSSQGEIIDPETKLKIGETSNPGELQEVWKVANKVKENLESAGYKVSMTKASINDAVTLAERTKRADNAKAQLVVSIHTTDGKFGNKSAGWVSEQRVGLYRTATDGKNISFTNQDIATKSHQYAEIMASERTKAGDGAQIHDLDFNDRADKNPGNIPVSQLLSSTPWVYNETGRAGYSSEKYINGITNGIKAAIKPGGGQTNSQDAGCGGGAVAGNIVETALSYAWSDRKVSPPQKKKPTYDAATKKAKAAGKYTGDACFGGGVDCGAFVTRVVQDSGVDKNYGGGGNTSSQLSYAQKNYKEIRPRTTADMQPGDIAIKNGHTYMYVGKQPGFGSEVASASQCQHAPWAGTEAPADPEYRWFRIIKAGG